jgi:hypothetical protein
VTVPALITPNSTQPGPELLCRPPDLDVMAAGLRVACALLWLTVPASTYRSSGSLN